MFLYVVSKIVDTSCLLAKRFSLRASSAARYKIFLLLFAPIFFKVVQNFETLSEMFQK